MRLHEDVQDVTVLVYRAPQILLATLDRDEHLVGAMVYTFARVSAVLKMRVLDYFIQGRRGWVCYSLYIER